MPIVISITAKNGKATSANCFSDTATPRLAAAQKRRPRTSRAKARTSASSAGASAVPNHEPRTASGFAARTAPIGSFQIRGAGKSKAAKRRPNVASMTKIR